jgi:hypothetical protein
LERKIRQEKRKRRQALVASLIGGGLPAIGVERLLDRLLPEGKMMRTLRMKVYPELRNYRKRQGES